MLQDVGSGHRIVEGGTADQDDQQQPQDIDTDVAFAARSFLPPSCHARPLFGRLHRSTIERAALGVGSCEGACCGGPRRAGIHHMLPRAIVSPLRKVFIDVLLGSRSCGSMSHWHPVRLRYRMVLMISRMSTARGRPPGFAGGKSGYKIFH